jgi:hypothetical protein
MAIKRLAEEKSMERDHPAVAVSRKVVWAGRIMSTLPVLMLVMSGVMKLLKPDPVKEGFTKLGLDVNLATGLGILELTCTLLYVIPKTSVLGAILLTGYFGGAILTHLRVGEQFIGPVVLGLLIWGGLYLRDSRVRALLPFRSAQPVSLSEPPS